MADDFLMGAACCSSVENPGMVMFQARSVWTRISMRLIQCHDVVAVPR